MPAFFRYTLTRRPPARLVYRNAIVLLECCRDVALPTPTWVFRARRASPLAADRTTHRPATVSSLVAAGRPLPSISPAAIAAAAEQRAHQATVHMAVSVYGRKDLERQLKRGLVLAAHSPEARVMDALVRLGYAESRRT